MNSQQISKQSLHRLPQGHSGFSLVEFLISSFILVTLGASVFSMIAEVERSSGYQTEIQAVQQNTRTAMDTIERCIKQAGNNPTGAVFEGVTIVSPAELHLRADLTGSAPGYPNQGDPDGDTFDLDEDVIVRYNAGERAIEMVLPDASVRRIADYITGLTMEYFDALGTQTLVGADVRRIRVTINGGTTMAHPQTHKTYGVTVTTSVQVATRT